MTGLLPNGKQQFIDINGKPLVGGFVYFFIPGTTAPKDTWQDAAQTTPNTNPVVLDSRGQALIYGEGQYRQVVRDSLGNTIWDQLTDSPSTISALVFCGDGGGKVIPTGIMRPGYCPFDCTITRWTVSAETTGSIVMDIWALPFANDSLPTIANSICGSNFPTLSTNSQVSSKNLNNWSVNIVAGTAMMININSISTITKATLTLTVTR